MAEHAFVQFELAAEEIGDGFASAVIVGGAEATAGDDQVGAVERLAERGAHVVERIANHGLVNHADADLIEAVSEKQGIRVEAVGREQF